MFFKLLSGLYGVYIKKKIYFCKKKNHLFVKKCYSFIFFLKNSQRLIINETVIKKKKILLNLCIKNLFHQILVLNVRKNNKSEKSLISNYYDGKRRQKLYGLSSFKYFFSTF